MIPLPELPQGPPRPGEPRDPNVPASAERTLFDLDLSPEQARVVAVPVPYQATVSGNAGTLDGPRALLDASGEIDLIDPGFGEPWRAGIAALPESDAIRRLSERAAAVVRDCRSGRAGQADAVDAAGRELADWTADVVAKLLEQGRVPILIGGEHGVSRGAFEALAARSPGVGLLQIDAHADLREAYEGWRSSHASVMARALEQSGIARLVQVGLRDVCPEERERAAAEPNRVRWYPDAEIASRRSAGDPFDGIVRDIVGDLPDRVWVSLDVDGLDPALCPTTGTPVPGGLGWHELGGLMAGLMRSGRTLLGADVVEVGPATWDGQVAARIVYRLAAVAISASGP